MTCSIPRRGGCWPTAAAQVLVGLGATGSPATYARQRSGLMARVEDNQIFGAMSFAVGYNPFTPADQDPFLDASLLAAPASMTPRHNNILVEMGTDSTEGLITAEWSYARLKEIRAQDEPALRSTMPVDAFGPALSVLYSRGLTIGDAQQIGSELSAPAPVAELAAGTLAEELPSGEGQAAGEEVGEEAMVAEPDLDTAAEM